ncbi:MAG: SIR2 family NAD-dependent protein deacylase, partial [Gemmataceae bacterium]
SAESGVPTFRASDGLWEGHRIEDVATPRGFARDPKLVWEFYNARRANVTRVRPNPAHFALVAFESQWEDDFFIATQNVDGLHQAAGSSRVHELHGSLRRTRCLGCEAITDRGLEPLGAEPRCPDCGGRLRPDIVWFEEMLPADVLHASQIRASECDLFFVVGTSAVVYPAAGLIGIAHEAQARIIEINLAKTAASEYASAGLYGPAGVHLPAIVQALGWEMPAL